MERTGTHKGASDDLKVITGGSSRKGTSAPVSPPNGFTVPFLRKLTAADQPFDISDLGALGLRLRVGRDGSKVFRWTVNVREGDRRVQKVITIGTWGEEIGPGIVSLEQAHALLARLKAAHEVDALDAEVARIAFEVASPVAALGMTVKELADEFYKRRIQPHRKRPEAALYSLNGHIVAKLGTVPITSLTPVALGKFLDGVVDDGAKVYAATVLQMLKQLLRYAVARGYLVSSPADALDPKNHGVVPYKRGDRVLAVKELPLFIAAMRATHYPEKEGKLKRGENRKRQAPDLKTRLALQLVLLTACRPGEILKAEWHEVDLKAKTWAIPPAKQKLGLEDASRAKPFTVTLSPEALALFEELARLRVKGNAYVVPGDVEGQPLSEKVLGRTMSRMQDHEPALLKLPGGRVKPHDLRRTARTLLGETLGVEPAIAERCLNHSLGKLTAIYDKGEYVDRRREAMNKLGALVMPTP